MNPKTEWLVAPDGKPALVNSSDVFWKLALLRA